MKTIKNIPTDKLAKVVEDLTYEKANWIEITPGIDKSWNIHYTLKKQEPDGWEGDLTNQL